MIASRAGGITERIRHGENGFLFPLGDREALTEVMARVLEMPEGELEAVREKAQVSVRDLNPNSFIRELLANYQTLGL